MLSAADLAVSTLGPCRFDSPLLQLGDDGFVDDDSRIRAQHKMGPGVVADELSFEEGGPRRRIFFQPEKVTAAIVTCGGLCPGINNVIRSVYCELTYNHRVPRVLGIRNGYLGLDPASGLAPIELTSTFVDHIHELGGTVLGSSRGPQEVSKIVDTLERERIDILICVGGDGTQRGAHAIHQEVQARGLLKSIVGVPKTIDNDIDLVAMSFGYNTAMAKAEEVLRGAHVEARGMPNGIGLVKLMGRNAGFIAAGAALASQDANFVLIPEVPFQLEGEGGFLEALERESPARTMHSSWSLRGPASTSSRPIETIETLPGISFPVTSDSSSASASNRISRTEGSLLESNTSIRVTIFVASPRTPGTGS